VLCTTNGMCVKSNTKIYVAQTSNNRDISSGHLYCCLLPQVKLCDHNTRNILPYLSHTTQQKKMIKGEHALGFKSCDIPVF